MVGLGLCLAERGAYFKAPQRYRGAAFAPTW